MTKTIRLAVLALLVAAAGIAPATAQVRFGFRLGTTVNKLRFDREVIDSDNRMGYTGGLLVDLNLPVIGVGIEASAMYTHRSDRLVDEGNQHMTFKRDYIEFPVYARYRLSLPVLDKVFAPYVYTGPCFSVLFHEGEESTRANSKTYVSWDAGAGVDLLNHLRISATYGIGISKAMQYIKQNSNHDKIVGKDRHWTINAAWLF